MLRFLRCDDTFEMVFPLKILKFTTRFLLFLYILFAVYAQMLLAELVGENRPACEIQQTGM